jgi:hypothetical protein
MDKELQEETVQGHPSAQDPFKPEKNGNFVALLLYKMKNH